MLADDLIQGELRKNLSKIHSSGMTLLSIINDILDISKIESGKFDIVPVEYDIPSLINDTVMMNIMRIGNKPIEFRLDIDESLPARLYGDDIRLKQVFNNLLSNAFKYTNEGFVEWRLFFSRDGGGDSGNDGDCGCDSGGDCGGDGGGDSGDDGGGDSGDDGGGGWLICQVRDSGIGIKPESVKDLFGDYNQLDVRAHRDIQGTGLGLSLAKKLAVMMGGDAEVESEFGKGSCFTVKIRQKATTDVHIDAEVIDKLKSFNYFECKRDRYNGLEHLQLPNVRVLVVDDVPTNLDVARGMLKTYGMHVDCAAGGKQAIDLIRKEEFVYDAIFMDHMMPGIDGVEAVRILRETGSDYIREVPIIALTANAVKGNAEMFLNNGFHAFLSKPINPRSLDEIIRRLLWDKGVHSEIAEMRSEIGKASRAAGVGIARINIAGLDMAKAVERFNGDEGKYLKVLQTYAASTGQMLDLLENAGEGDLGLYKVTVHGLKGASRGVGADGIGDCAEKLEKAASAGDYAYIAANTKAFAESVRGVIGDIEAMLSAVSIKKPKIMKDRPDEKILMKLLSACASYDIESVDEAIAELELYQYETDNGLAAWLIENVKMMNFEQIIEKLSV